MVPEAILEKLEPMPTAKNTMQVYVCAHCTVMLDYTVDAPYS